MSHCTNFEFQYTDKKLITKAFEQLGLSCFEDVVCTYESSYDKQIGNVSIKRPAIIAKRDGFNYFMEDFGNHFELSIEKHDMDRDEERCARRMGSEFRKIYIKCAAETVIEQMQANGQICILEETSNGFEIKFGSMYEKSLLVKFENGRVLESVQGVKGQSCQSLTEALEKMLSSSDAELNTEWTEEYYEPDDGSALKVYDLGF